MRKKQRGNQGGIMARDPRSAGERLSEGVRTLLTGANFAHLSTLMPDGAPNVDPVWVDVEGDMVVVCSGAGALKSKNARRDRASDCRLSQWIIRTRKRRFAAGSSSSARTRILRPSIGSR
ncbi:MAG TPA: pyridoxamine 5'-phosphate oxidase family protein, partial [Candidatus Binatia bacterium]